MSLQTRIGLSYASLAAIAAAIYVHGAWRWWMAPAVLLWFAVCASLLNRRFHSR